MKLPHYLIGLFCLLFCTIGNSSNAHEGDHEIQVAPVPEGELHRPTAMPERILLSWKDDPAHTQAVTWRTSTEVDKAVAEISVAEAGSLFVDKAWQLPAETSKHYSDLGPAHYHSVNFTKLKPNTLYVYRLGDGTNWSAWNHFRTASEKPKPFTFVYFGDAQNSLKSHWSRVFRKAFVDAPKARFMLHAGDLVNRGNRDAEWGEWCNAGGWVNATIPTLAVPGNHEYDIDRLQEIPESKEQRDELPKNLSTRWQQRFEFPENGPPEFRKKLNETAYFLDYQGVRFVALNSMEDFGTQACWLRGVLEDNPNRWTIVTHHHPVFSVSDNRDNSKLRDAWQPIYDEYRVDLVLQGHDHSYGRTGLRHHINKKTGAAFRSCDAGTLYVVSVSGPKMYDRGEGKFVRLAEDTQLYQIVTVDGDRLLYQAKTATGELYDAFTLVKSPGAVNKLVEQVPNTPQRLRVKSKD